jgi:hypothetical protein
VSNPCSPSPRPISWSGGKPEVCRIMTFPSWSLGTRGNLMVQDLSLSEQLAFSTVRIECKLESGEISTGTGFFFRFAEEGTKYVPAIVTNKHVIQNSIEGKFYLTLSDKNNKPIISNQYCFVIQNFMANWIFHPDPNIDLCVMPIASLLTQSMQLGKRFFFISLDRKLILTPDELSNLTLLEEIVMVGYPNGIWDRINNMPIFRKGITATHPNLNLNGKPEFMIDAACFPGSSGSPVFLFNLGSYPVKSGGLTIGTRVKLLGILYAGPQCSISGELEIVNVPTQQMLMPISQIPINLGIVIKAQKLYDFDHFFAI